MDRESSRVRQYVRAIVADLEAVARRVGQNRISLWLLYSGRRLFVSLALLAGVFFTFLGLAYLRPVDMARLISDTATLQTLFSDLLSGAILLVSIVSSISSIVLTQEITDIDTQQNRIDASVNFRERTENLIETDISPAQPADFLEVILYTIYEDSLHLRRVAASSESREFDEEVEAFTDEILDEARSAAETLDGAQFGTFNVLAAGLHYDYSWQLNTARSIQTRYNESLSDEEIEALSNLVDTLKFFATGREYFQSLYYKREMARLSSSLLYVSLPIIVFISYIILAIDGEIVPVVDLGRLSSLSVFIILAYTISLAPYVVLTAHVIRVAAITLQTLAAGPFVVGQRSEHDIVDLDLETDPTEWETPDDIREQEDERESHIR